MDYIGVREVAVTAREEGKIEGKEEGKEEMVIEMHLDGIDIARIAKIAKMSLDRAKAIIDASAQKRKA